MQHRIVYVIPLLLAVFCLILGLLLSMLLPADARECSPAQRDDRYPHLESKCPAPGIWSPSRTRRVVVDANSNAASTSALNLLRAYAAHGAATTSRACLTSDTRAVLEAAERNFGVRFTLESTCRPRATIAGSGDPSWHRVGRAVDLLVPRGVAKSTVVRWFFNHARGVTMTYRNMAHVHFDTGTYHRLVRGADASGGRRHARRHYQRHARR